ncbi:winged helix-turn-helix transcriptional regulator [Sediminibacterium ginsengisoli]|uniref:DNA-binding transcriptional regulator, HxlR family n=1 Tax=Sediminibacterium ginsengisoli TaxID=413434 RepID=A0A1T4KV11_9BACT|nr:winged helix-turn-helix transcriptional regulator [Sediminibacterium ginsengisoli]SJZ46137.1 DNA-binding transcriptional regulator, HxlR family [Sediminibacterium ginsengisoli]
MRERKIPLNLNCGLDLAGEVLYGKWKIRLLWFINAGHKRPSELQRKIPDASRRVLNVQLNELEAHGLIKKKIFAVVPPKVEYSLTSFGETIIPVIGTLGKWADENENRLRDLIQNINIKQPEEN